MSIKNIHKSEKNTKKRNLLLCAFGIATFVGLTAYDNYENTSNNNLIYEVDKETYLLNTIEEYLIEAHRNNLTTLELQQSINMTIDSYKSTNSYPEYISMMFAKIQVRLEKDIEDGKSIDEIVGRIYTCLTEVRCIKEGISSYEPEETKHR